MKRNQNLEAMDVVHGALPVATSTPPSALQSAVGSVMGRLQYLHFDPSRNAAAARCAPAAAMVAKTSLGSLDPRGPDRSDRSVLPLATLGALSDPEPKILPAWRKQ